MQKKWVVRSHSMQSVFVFLLIGLFALTTTTLAIIGTRVYRKVTDAAAYNNASQMLLSYLSNKVRSFDTYGGVYINSQDGISTLHLLETLDDEPYETTIYGWKGSVWERTAVVGEPFDPENATQLTQANALTFVMLSDSLIEATIEMQNGDIQTLCMALRAGGRRKAD